MQIHHVTQPVWKVSGWSLPGDPGIGRVHHMAAIADDPAVAVRTERHSSDLPQRRLRRIDYDRLLRNNDGVAHVLPDDDPLGFAQKVRCRPRAAGTVSRNGRPGLPAVCGVKNSVPGVASNGKRHSNSFLKSKELHMQNAWQLNSRDNLQFVCGRGIPRAKVIPGFSSIASLQQHCHLLACARNHPQAGDPSHFVGQEACRTQTAFEWSHARCPSLPAIIRDTDDSAFADGPALLTNAANIVEC